MSVCSKSDIQVVLHAATGVGVRVRISLTTLAKHKSSNSFMAGNGLECPTLTPFTLNHKPVNPKPPNSNHLFTLYDIPGEIIKLYPSGSFLVRTSST